MRVVLVLLALCSGFTSLWAEAQSRSEARVIHGARPWIVLAGSFGSVSRIDAPTQPLYLPVSVDLGTADGERRFGATFRFGVDGNGLAAGGWGLALEQDFIQVRLDFTRGASVFGRMEATLLFADIRGSRVGGLGGLGVGLRIDNIVRLTILLSTGAIAEGYIWSGELRLGFDFGCIDAPADLPLRSS